MTTGGTMTPKRVSGYAETADGRCAAHLVQMWMAGEKRFCPMCLHQDHENLKAEHEALKEAEHGMYRSAELKQAELDAAKEQLREGAAAFEKHGDETWRLGRRIEELEMRDRIRADTVTKLSKRLAQDHAKLIEGQKTVERWQKWALDACEYAWAVIANASGGDWDSPVNLEGWREAAERWRDTYWHPLLKAMSATQPRPLDEDRPVYRGNLWDHAKTVAAGVWGEPDPAAQEKISGVLGTPSPAEKPTPSMDSLIQGYETALKTMYWMRDELGVK